MFELDRQPKRRVVVHDNRDAKLAISDVVSQFERWRYALTLMNAKLDRPHSDAERQMMTEQCALIRGELTEARTELILRLADAPRRVSGHSRVVDVERALDGVDAMLDDLDGRLKPSCVG